MAETKKTEAAAAAAPPEAACLTLRQKLVEMRKACPEIVKKQHSDGVSYKYAKIYDVWEKITPIMNELGVDFDVISEQATRHAEKPVICMTMIDLLERIKRTYSATGGSESDVLKIYKTVPLLVIDDIGKEPPTEWAISTVYNIINGRYEAYLPTIVTTNYDTEALIDRMTPRESHDSMTARATIDRLMEMCRGITLTGQSWRSR